MDRNLVKLSKFLSLILRHKPQTVGLRLDETGWADVGELIDLVSQQGIHISRELLEEIVGNSEEKSFIFNADKSRIRSYQEQSSKADLALISEQPPQYLFYCTTTRFLATMRSQGLMPGNQSHVQLSPDELVAIQRGQRYGQSIVLTIKAAEMFRAGHPFYRSDQGVWLTETVPPWYIQFSKAPTNPAE